MYGGIPWGPPMEKECEIWNNGETQKAFVRSALIPVNRRFVRRTSLDTSRESCSTVPGLARPSPSLRFDIFASVSDRLAINGFSMSQSMANAGWGEIGPELPWIVSSAYIFHRRSRIVHQAVYQCAVVLAGRDGRVGSGFFFSYVGHYRA